MFIKLMINVLILKLK